MGRESKYFTLTLESLRALGSWTADCAERALPVYEKHAGSDSRPRAAIEGIRVWACLTKGRRSVKKLRGALSDTAIWKRSRARSPAA